MKPGVFTQASSAGVYHLTHTQASQLPAIATQAKREFCVIDLSACKTKHQALVQLGHGLAFPDWYGANFDALNDCLQDQDWRPKNGLIAKISGLDHLSITAGEACITLIEIFTSACQPEHTANLAPLWFLIDTPITGIKPLPKA